MKNQLIILWIGIGLVVIAIMFPPWVGKVASGQSKFAGYGFLFSPPSPSHGKYISSYIERSRLTAEILIIILLTAGALFTNHVATDETRQGFRRGIKFGIKLFAWCAVIIAVFIWCTVALKCVCFIKHWIGKKPQPISAKPWENHCPTIHPAAQVDTATTPRYEDSTPVVKTIPLTPVVYETIHKAAIHGDFADVKRHLNNGVETDTRDPRGKTPLMWAVSRDAKGYLMDKERLDIVKSLVCNGADVNAKDKNGNTVLTLAAYEGNLDIVKVLVYNGADINATNINSETPLSIAKSRSANTAGNGYNFFDVVEFLSQHKRIPAPAVPQNTL